MISGPPKRIELDVFEKKNEILLRCSVLDCVPQPMINLQLDGRILIERNDANIVTSQVAMRDGASIKCVVTIVGTNYTDSVKHKFSRSNAVANSLTSHSGAKILHEKSVLVTLFLLSVQIIIS